MATPSSSPVRLYALLVLVLILVLLNQGLYTADVIRGLSHQSALSPFWLGDPWPTIIGRRPAGVAAGLRQGDRIVRVEGRPLTGDLDLAQIVHGKKPNDTLGVTLNRSGEELQFQVPLPSNPYVTPSFYAIVSWLLMPWFSIAIGFWVAALRPRDIRAWLVCGILIGLSGIGRTGVLEQLGWGAPGLIASVFHETTSLQGWGICMMLFGMYFPHRWELDVKYPWVKWALAGPALAFALFEALRIIAFATSHAAGVALVRAVPIPDWLQIVWVMILHSFFFVGLSTKLADPSFPRDDRRRIRLLYFGCSAAMAPLFLLFIFDAAVHHRMPGDADGQLLGITTLLMFLFPVAMAYVIVVQRAMDVRMTIRQGVQYALARRGIRFLQGVAAASIILFAVYAADSRTISRPQRMTIIALGAALILRLRDLGERVRRWLDRRFFREAYNSELILGELSEQVRSLLDRETLLGTVARKICDSLHVDTITVLLQEGAFFRPAYATAVAPQEIPLEADVETVSRKLGAELLLPLNSKKDLLGYIGLGPKKSEEPYSPSDIALLRTVAAQTGMALENTRLSEAFAAEVAQRELLHREIEIAREVQERLFPQNLPAVPSLEYAGHCRPARGVGGDYYDFLALSNGRLGLAIGDVSGKGVPAALLMASLQASVRGQSQGLNPQGKPDIASLMANVNRLVYDASPSNRYATFFYGQFDPTTRTLIYTNGGHNAPMLLRGDEVLRLEDGGPPVGLFRPAQYTQSEVQMQRGDILVLYTDGISEAENPAEEEWGEDALIAAARVCRDQPPSEMITRILHSADIFANGAPQHDDMTVVIARVL